MEGWRAGQSEITEHFLANRLDGIQYELIVRSGDIWRVLSELISAREIDLVVVGTRGRTGMRKLILGSVAEDIFRQAPCPVLTVGPGSTAQDPEVAPERILTATGFAPHSIFGVRWAIALAHNLGSSVALLHVITGKGELSEDGKDKARDEGLAKLRALSSRELRLPSAQLFLVEFGSAPEKILEVAASWGANLIVLGLHRVPEASKDETTFARAYEIVTKASCPVLTVRAPDEVGENSYNDAA
jgi:nucleotide-binding universal stress UspA family protein